MQFIEGRVVVVVALANQNKNRHRFRMIVPGYPAFNIYSGIARITTALGPVCIATAVNRMGNWDAEVIDENNFHQKTFRTSGLLNHLELQQFRPAEVVGLYGGLTSTIPRLYAIAQTYRDMGITTIAGGQHFIDENVEEALANGIDYVVIGEGEETITELLAALENGESPEQIRGIAWRSESGAIIRTADRERLCEFDGFPLPDFSLVHYAHIKIYPVERIRGCGMECEFCTVKGRPRPATPERLLEQISNLVETKQAKHFFVVDDLFGQQREETMRFLDMIVSYQEHIGKRLDLTVQIRLDKAKDPELLGAMRHAGVNTVAIGFESPIKEELESMQKHIRPEEMISLVKVYRKHGFLIHGMFIFGYPSEKQSTIKISLTDRMKAYRQFIRKAGIDTIQILLPVPLPGTLLRKRLMNQHRIYDLKNIGWEYYDGNFPLFEPDPPYTAEQLQICCRKIMGHFYRFKNLFMVGYTIFSFPSMVFFLHNIDRGWKRWYRNWRNSVIRFGGWIIIKGWTAEFKKNSFLLKLRNARQYLRDTYKIYTSLPESE